jgi:hypothetical protein
MQMASKAAPCRSHTSSMCSLEAEARVMQMRLYSEETSRTQRRTRQSGRARTWLVNEHDMTNEGWPVAQPRLSRRPSARMMMPWPSGKTKRSHCGLIVWRLMPCQLMTPAMSISLSKWPMLPTIALFFIFAMWLAMMMSLLPVVVMKMSACSRQSSSGRIWKPSMDACSAMHATVSKMCHDETSAGTCLRTQKAHCRQQATADVCSAAIQSSNPTEHLDMFTTVHQPARDGWCEERPGLWKSQPGAPGARRWDQSRPR